MLGRITVDRTLEFNEPDPLIIVTFPDGYCIRFWVQRLKNKEYIRRATVIRLEEDMDDRGKSEYPKKEAAEYLGIKLSSVVELIKTGDLVGQYRDGDWFITAKSMLTYLSMREQALSGDMAIATSM